MEIRENLKTIEHRKSNSEDRRIRKYAKVENLFFVVPPPTHTRPKVAKTTSGVTVRLSMLCCSIFDVRFDVRCSIYDFRLPTVDFRCSVFELRVSSFVHVQHSMFDFRGWCFDVRCSFFFWFYLFVLFVVCLLKKCFLNATSIVFWSDNRH